MCDGLVFGEGFRAVIRELIYRGADTTILNHEDLDALTLTNDGAPDEYAQLALEAIREFVTTVEDEGAATAGGGGGVLLTVAEDTLPSAAAFHEDEAPQVVGMVSFIS